MKKTLSNNLGFTAVQLIITIAIMSTITGFAVLGISRARAGVRLSNSARQFAAYVERARADAVRRHDQAVVQTLTTTTYSVTMDFDNSGTVATRTFRLEEGVQFTTGIKSVTFNWRGRIPQEESFGFYNGRNSISVGITGSGDVTFDSQFFHDASLPAVTLSGPGGSVLPDPVPGDPYGGSPSASPSPSPSPGQGGPSPTPTPTPTANPSPTPTPTPTANPSPTPTPTPTASPTATPTPAPCALVASPSSLTVVEDGAATVSVYRYNATGSGTITASSSNNGQIQISPSSVSVSGSGAATFTVTVKKQSGSVTFSATSCGSTTVNVTVP